MGNKFRPLSSLPKARPKPRAEAEGLPVPLIFDHKDRQARMRSAASSVSDRHRIAGWVVPSWKAGGSVAEQYLRGFYRVKCRVQVGDTGYGGVPG